MENRKEGQEGIRGEKPLRVVVRADASEWIGTGHIMRCLTLAEQLRDTGAQVSFICRELPGNLCTLIEAKGFVVWRLPYRSPDSGHTEETAWLGADWQTDALEVKDILEEVQDIPEDRDVLEVQDIPEVENFWGAKAIDWLIADNYAIDKRWEAVIRPFVKKIMVIDDLANRPHDCDLLVDQNYYHDRHIRYHGLVPADCLMLLGPEYALLRREFKEAKKNLRQRDGFVRRMLVFYGGSDPTNETAKALEAIRALDRPEITIDVVVGQANPHREEIKQMTAELPNANFYCQVSNMAELMSLADLALGAGGASTWERCFLGLPAITTVTAQNQAGISNDAAALGVARNLGWHSEVKASGLKDVLRQALAEPGALVDMGQKALQLMGGTSHAKQAVLLQAIVGDRV